MPTANTKNLTGEDYSISLQLPPLPLHRPLLMIGHGTRDEVGRQSLLDFASIYQALDSSRPVVPCFLELTSPTIQEGWNIVWLRDILTSLFCQCYFLQRDTINLISLTN